MQTLRYSILLSKKSNTMAESKHLKQYHSSQGHTRTSHKHTHAHTQTRAGREREQTTQQTPKDKQRQKI